MQIFISYGRGDALEFARKLAAWLKDQGFTPWLDVDEGIPLGSPFDVRIELGIEGSDLLIALLSPWSLRSEGFCRNELLFAQAKKRPIIPVRIADVTPPIQIIALNYLDACADPDAVFQKLAAFIRQVAQSGQMTLRDWPAVAAGLPWWADQRQLRFHEELARHGDRFIGREWLFAQLREWIAQPASRLLLVTAEAGFGKSALAAQLTARFNVRGVHFCSRSQVESCKPAAWLTGLVYQLAAQFPAYRDKLDPASPHWNQPGESLFRALIADPLRELAGQLPVAEPWVFVLDALDESVAEGGRALADLLTDSAERIPDWLRIIVTSRPDSNIIAQFTCGPIRCKHLDAEGSPNMADVNRYITERITWLEHSGAIGRRAGTAERLAELAHGNFLFARLTLEALTDADPARRLSLDEMGSLPAKLGGLYHAMFRRRFRDPDAYDREILPLLDCLVAARGPVPKELLQAAAGLDSRTFQRGLRALSQFLNSGATGYRVFHQSLADWLADDEASGEFAASQHEGREKLNSICWSSYQKDARQMPPYALLHTVAHLTDAGRWEDVCQILCDLRFIEARCKVGQVFELIADYRLAQQNLPEAQADLVKEQDREAEAHRWTREIIAYAKAWSDHRDHLVRIEPVDEPRPTLPKPPATCQIWTDKEIQAECERIIKAPMRRDRLEAFAGFVTSQCYLLVGHGSRLGFVLQHAFNNEPAGPVHDAAVLLLPALRGPHMLRRWSADAVHNPKSALLRTLQGHGEGVWSTSVTPDGRRAVSGGMDTTLRVWDLESGACLRMLEGHSQGVRSVTVTPDMRRAISGSEDKTIRVWDLETGACLKTLEGHSQGVCSVSLTPDGLRAVSGSEDKTIRVWDLESGTCLRTLEGHSHGVRSVSVTPDGRRAVSGGMDTTLRVWDLESGACLRMLEGHSQGVRSVTVTPDMRRAISGSEDKTIRVWDLESGTCPRILEGHSDRVGSVSATPDGRRAVSGSDDKTLRVWDLESGVCLRTLKGHSTRVNDVRVTPDGRCAVSGSFEKAVRVWDLESGACLRALEGHSQGVRSVSVTPDGRCAVSGSGDLYGRGDNTLRIWDLESGACLRTLDCHTRGVLSVGVAQDRRCTVSGSFEKAVRVWDLESGACLRILEGHSKGVLSVSVTPDGRWALSGSRDNTLRVWDLESGACLRTLEGHREPVRSVSITPDGRCAVSGGEDMTLRMWDLESGACLRTLEGHRDAIWSVCVTPDGGRAVSGSGNLIGSVDNSLRVWDLERGACLRTLEGHSDAIWSVCMTPDGRHAISGGLDNTLRMWDLERGTCLAVFPTAAPVVAVTIVAGRVAIGAGASPPLFLDVRGIQDGPDLKPDMQPVINDEGYEQLLRRGLQITRLQKGNGHAETLAHLTALAVHLEKMGKCAEASAFAQERDAIAAHSAARKDGGKDNI